VRTGRCSWQTEQTGAAGENSWKRHPQQRRRYKRCGERLKKCQRALAVLGMLNKYRQIRLPVKGVLQTLLICS
jgi:hypothetical protein